MRAYRGGDPVLLPGEGVDGTAPRHPPSCSVRRRLSKQILSSAGAARGVPVLLQTGIRGRN